MMANESYFGSTPSYENLSISSGVFENFLTNTELSDRIFNNTEISDSLLNVTQLPEISLNGSQVYETLLTCLDDNENFSNNDSICSWTSAPYSSPWDTILTTEVVVNSIVCILGILGNIYALVIIFRMKLDTFVHKWRKSMAICDFLLLACDLHQVTIVRIARNFIAYQNHSIYSYTYLWVLLYPIRKMIETASAWITVSVVIERCVFLRNPSRALSLCRYRMSGILFLFITIFVTSINFPRFREYHVKKCFDAKMNICTHEIRQTDASDVIQNYRDILDWIYVCVTYIVPFLILIISSCLLWRPAYKSDIDQEKLKDIEPGMNSIRMIIVFVLLFFVCRLPKMVEEVYSNIGILTESMTPFSNLMLSINSAVNFIIYLLF